MPDNRQSQAAEALNSRALERFATLAWLAAIACVVVVGVLVFQRVPGILDEGVHAAQSMFLLSGRWEQHSALTTIPGYHLLIATLSSPWAPLPVENPDYDLLRLLSTVLALTLLPLAYRLARTRGDSRRQAVRRTYSLLVIPGIVPLSFMLYTDVVALVPLLLATLALQSGRGLAAAAAVALAVMLRQSSIVWAGWVLMLACQRVPVSHWLEFRWREPLMAVLPALLVLMAFALFVLINGGVALGDREHHPSTQLSLDNVYMGLVYAWLVLLPLQAAAAKRFLVEFRAQPLRVLPGIALALAFWFGFAPDHPYNFIAPEAILHNGVIAAVQQPLARLMMAITLIWSLWTLQVTPMAAPGGRWLQLSMLLSLLPFAMVEPRYAMPALMLFFLLRQRESERIELAQAVWATLLALLLMKGYASQSYIL